jgi:hypothetical protein
MHAPHIFVCLSLVSVPVIGWIAVARTRERDLLIAVVIGLIAASALAAIAVRHPTIAAAEAQPAPRDED